MIVTKRVLSRRACLRGVGVTLALPLLDAMVPALTPIVRTAAVPACRLGFIYVPNGIARADVVARGTSHFTDGAADYWTPPANADGLSRILQPLAPIQRHVTIVSGLSQHAAEPANNDVGDHSRATATWLSGVRPRHTEDADVRCATTIDQIVAQGIGRATRVPSLELGIDRTSAVGNCEAGYSCVYINTLSWRTPTTPLPVETNPRTVFDRLFAFDGTPQQRAAQADDSRSILDSVVGGIRNLQGTIGPADRRRLEEYLDSVRAVEQRLATTETAGSEIQLPELARPVGIPVTFAEHVKLMCELVALAFQADVTRVFTFAWGREITGRAYPEIGVNEAHHAISHHQNNPTTLATLAKINSFHVELFASFVSRLQAIPDGDGMLLDHVRLLYGAGLSNPQVHTHLDLPLLVVGPHGSDTGSRRVRYPEGTPMTNLLVSLADAVGVPTPILGDSTGRVTL
jgi:hypothetical protein